MDCTGNNLFEHAIKRYQLGNSPSELLDDFIKITNQTPQHSAGWTCLAWLQLLENQREEALTSARTAVRLNPQDPQAHVNLCLALLENNAKGVREHIEIVKQIITIAPNLAKELKESLKDGLYRKPNWKSLKKVKKWLDL
uniref:TPR-repeat protein n=1 Tax=Paulinella chromatophora TaxID=39717 RepID=B1X469_PAUCH|nr:hypothetical protein PCC_0296 [Paulinella chromatophora]ACB42738.1 hypothetical protein PCC_0296 [Paulinella chromatophora]